MFGYKLNTAYCAGKFTNKSVTIQAGCMQVVFELRGRCQKKEKFSFVLL